MRLSFRLLSILILLAFLEACGGSGMGAFKSTTNSFFEKWKLISVNEMPVTEEEVILGIIDEKTMVILTSTLWYSI